MVHNENDLNFTVLGTDKIVANKNKSEFYNLKTGRNIKVVRNCRSFGIWYKRKFIPLSKIEIEDQSKMSDSSQLNRLLNELSNL